jgi:PAS domain S-box-containing protein
MAKSDSTKYQDRFKLLFENSFEAMVIFSPDGKILEVNQQMAELVGYRVEDMIGKNVYEFMLPIEREDAVDRTQKASEGQPLPMVERTVVRKDGSRFIGEANLSPIMDEDGNVLFLFGVLRDLTQRKQIENRLREKEAQLRQIGDNLPDGFIYQLIHTPDGKRYVRHMTAGVERMYGTPLEDVLADVNILYGMMLPEDLAAVSQAEEESVKNQTLFDWEGRFRLPSGEIRWTRYHSKPTVLPDGMRVWDGFALDITGQKRQEENDLMLRQLLDSLDAECFIKNKEGVYLYVNRAFENQFGVKREDVVGKDDVFIFGKENAKMLQENDRRIMQSQQPQSLEESGFLDGEFKTYISNKTPFLDNNGEVAGICGVGIDITHQKNIEEQLRKSEATARALMDASIDIALLTQPDGTIVALNDAAVQSLLGVRENLIGKNVLDLFPSELSKTRRARSEEVVRSGNPVQFEDTRGGKWFRNHIYPILDAQAQVSQLAIFAHDITERISLQQVSRELTNITDLPSTLDCVCGILEDLFDSPFVSIGVTPHDETIQIVMQSERSQRLPDMVLIVKNPAIQELIKQRSSLIVSELQTAPRLSEIRTWAKALNLHSVLLSPLIMRGEVFGFLFVSTDQETRVFSEQEVVLAELLSSDIASAIENARLLSLVQEQAVADERIRIARELHDSVTQTMYSISMVAEALPRLLDRNLDEAKRRVIHLRQMTLGALAEMRNLLFEFHPKALRDTRLSNLIRQLGEVLTGRTRIPVDIDVHENAQLSEDVKVAFYRVAQETFNNISKHAQTTVVRVVLRSDSNECSLSIQDDGVGFDPQVIDDEKLGLKIMTERAEQIGAELTVESVPNQGTHVLLVWKQTEVNG